MQAQVRPSTEARAGGDLVNVESGSLQQFAGDVDSSPEQPLEWRVTGVLNEAARERPVGDVGMLGEVADGEVLVQPGQRPPPGAGEGVVGILWQRSRYVLGLAAAAVRGRDDLPGDVV